MTLRKKAVIFLLTFFILWFVFNAIAISNGILGGYIDIENRRYEWQMDRVASGIEELITRHELLLLDWAEWDEAYEYVQHPNEVFERDIDESDHFEKQQMNYYVLYNEENRVLHTAGYDLEKKIAKDVPEKLLTALPNYKNESGLLYIDGTAMVFVTREVSNNDGTMPPKGLFAFIYEVNDNTLKKLSDSIKEQVTIESIYADGMHQDRVLNTEADLERFYGELFYKYKNIDQGVVLNVELDKSIRQIAEKTILGALLVFLGSFALLVVIIMSGVNRVLKRILKIVMDLSQINREGHLTERVTIEGEDELGDLRDSINGLLDELQDAHLKLVHQATYDDLTGVYNRRAGIEQLEKEIEKLFLNEASLTIVFVDINGLKFVNDTFGHHMGDDYLIHICHSIKMVMSLDDTIARLGGDEFLVIFPGKKADSVHDTFDPVHNIIEKIQDQYSLPYEMSISAGIFEYEAGMDVNQFIEEADELMYRQKMARRQSNASKED